MSDTTAVDQYLVELEKQDRFKGETVEKSILWYIAWYRKRAPARRLAFRAAGLAVLVASASLPFATSISSDAVKQWLLPLLAYVIAIVASLNAFFQWQQVWEGYMMALLQLESAWAEWGMSRCEAKLEPDRDKALSIIKSAAHKLNSKVDEVIAAETGGFFKVIKFPSAGVTSSGTTGSSQGGATGGATGAPKVGATGGATGSPQGGATGGASGSSKSGSTGGASGLSQGGATGGATGPSQGGPTGGATGSSTDGR